MKDRNILWFSGIYSFVEFLMSFIMWLKCITIHWSWAGPLSLLLTTGDQQWRLLSWCSCVTAVSFTRLRTARCWPRCVQFLLHCLHNCSWAGCGCLHSCPHHHNSWSDGWWLEPPWEPCSGSGDHQSVSSQSGHSYSSQVLSSAQAPAMADGCSMSHVPSP